MSMYEIEDLVEETVVFIDRYDYTPYQKRNLIWNAYNIQHVFDTGFTQMRQLDLLLRDQYLQPYDIADFPMTSQYPTFFGQLPSQSFEWIYKIPTDPSSETNRTVAFWDRNSGKIYTEFGSEYYTLHPDEKVVEYGPLEFGHKMVMDADKVNDKGIVYDWISFMPAYGIEWFPTDESEDELKSKYFDDIRRVYQNTDFSGHETLHDALDIDTYGEEWIDELPDMQRDLTNYILEK